ncbi:hypothetical protein IWW38_000150 [Coemansia aciculifera]|uniref:Uncharacterized protein n=1 Tax=Coemansia aciculifera TaxID=417176 RepID=A0ACC1MA63_9FUNG|nr:hypothetical protein IWW38_000150 [Coemansia aciculifera]
MRSEELEKIFAAYGKLSRCDVKRGVSLSYGFVEFDDLGDAEVAIKECNGMNVDGDRMVVEFAKRPARKRDDNSCFRCGQEGHWSKDCPDSRGGGGGGRSRSPRRYVPVRSSYDVSLLPLSATPELCPSAVFLLLAEMPTMICDVKSFGGRNRSRSRSRDRGDRGDRRGGRQDSDRRRPSNQGHSRSPVRGGRDGGPHRDSHRSSGGGYSRRNHSRSASRSPGPRSYRGGDGGRRPPPGPRSRSPPPSSSRGQRGDRYPDNAGEDSFRDSRR